MASLFPTVIFPQLISGPCGTALLAAARNPAKVSLRPEDLHQLGQAMVPSRVRQALLNAKGIEQD